MPLEKFKSQNENVRILESDEEIHIENVWSDETFYLKYRKEDSFDEFKDIVLSKELFALYHKDRGMYEFVFLPLSKEYKRQFKYIFCGNTYNLYYGVPSDKFKNIAKHCSFNNYAEISDRSYSLLKYKSYYSEIEEENITGLFPTNFFIEGDFENLSYEKHLEFFKHVNFMLNYYDRQSPNIIIYDKTDNEINDINEPCKNKQYEFPQIINGGSLDPTLLDLMDAANNAGSYRLKYIFYYQILEYSSYYYIENDLRRKITNVMKSPDILNTDKYSHKIIEIYSEYFKSNKDEKRMERLLSDLCCYDDIKEDIKSNKKYFLQDINFDGGFSIKSLFKNENEIDEPNLNSIFVSIRKNIESIRNVLVHARESRENAVIKPTQRNSSLLAPYLYLLRRIAETIIIKY